jgi:hypothetical protein
MEDVDVGMSGDPTFRRPLGFPPCGLKSGCGWDCDEECFPFNLAADMT